MGHRKLHPDSLTEYWGENKQRCAQKSVRPRYSTRELGRFPSRFCEQKYLLAFLTWKAEYIDCIQTNLVYVTSGKYVLGVGACSPILYSNHTIETHVVTPPAGTFHYMAAAWPFVDICVAFGMANNYWFYSIIVTFASLGKSRALPVYHAVSGCFCLLCVQEISLADQDDDTCLKLFEKTSPSNSVLEVRKDIFCQKDRSLDKLRTTQSAPCPTKMNMHNN